LTPGSADDHVYDTHEILRPLDSELTLRPLSLPTALGYDPVLQRDAIADAASVKSFETYAKSSSGSRSGFERLKHFGNRSSFHYAHLDLLHRIQDALRDTRGVRRLQHRGIRSPKLFPRSFFGYLYAHRSHINILQHRHLRPRHPYSCRARTPGPFQ
jgi:hypothetical protein